MIKLTNAKEYLKDLFEEPFDLEEGNSIESDFYNIIKQVQRDTVEKTLQIASESADADFNYIGEPDSTPWREDIEVYVINYSITGLKDKIFKENNL